MNKAISFLIALVVVLLVSLTVSIGTIRELSKLPGASPVMFSALLVPIMIVSGLMTSFFFGLLINPIKEFFIDAPPPDSVEYKRGGATAANGYLDLISEAKSTIHVTHLDGDPPGPAVIKKYQTIIEGGTSLHRLVFLKEDIDYEWLKQFFDAESGQCNHHVVKPYPEKAIAALLKKSPTTSKCRKITFSSIE